MNAFLRLSFLIVALVIVFTGLSQEENDALPTTFLGLEIDSIHGVMHCIQRTDPPRRVRLGHENIRDIFESCARAPIAVVANHTSIVPGEWGPVHLVDTLLSLGINVQKVFAPEHGFRGNAHNGANIDDDLDSKTGLPLLSLHGKHRKPTPSMMEDIRMVVFDIQDIGARFYTYLSTLFLVMDAASESGAVVMVLDRPNPHGHQMAGPVLEPKWTSFVGQVPVPMVHGMTLGEMARMINGEGWLPGGKKCELIVIPCEGYAHSDRWFPTIAPSPNLPSDASIALYPSLCLFEPTAASIGRGTPHPFECVGFPGMPDGSFSFTPEPIAGAAPHPKHEGVACVGHNLTGLAEEWIQGNHGYDLSWIADYSKYWDESHPGEPFIQTASSFGRLAGTDSLLRAFQTGNFQSDYPPSWLEDLQAFHKTRLPYLLYPLQRDAAQK